MTDRVLVLDDDRLFGEQVGRALREAGLGASVVHSVQVFKETFAKFQPTLLVLDVVIGDEDVCSVVNFLADTGYRQPVMFVSGADFRLRNLVSAFARDRGLYVTETVDKRTSVSKILQLARSYRVRGAPCTV